MSASEFDVPGISCGKCVGRIEAALAGLDGVDGVIVDVDGKQVRVNGTADEGGSCGRLSPTPGTRPMPDRTSVGRPSSRFGRPGRAGGSRSQDVDRG